MCQIDHRLDETHSHYDSWRSHHTEGLVEQNPGDAVNELEALDWERPAKRDHDGLTASIRMFLHAKWGPYVGIDCRILVGWLHPAST